MQYEGKLYGKVGKSYFPLIETAADFDQLKSEKAELVEVLMEFVEAVESESIIIHENTDNDGWENTGGRLFSKAKQILTKHQNQ